MKVTVALIAVRVVRRVWILLTMGSFDEVFAMACMAYRESEHNRKWGAGEDNFKAEKDSL